MGISKPRIFLIPGGYKVFWEEGDEKNITMAVTRLVEDHRSRMLAGEFEVTVNHNAKPQILIADSRVNLSSSRARAEFAKRLQDRVINEEMYYYPWDTLLEQVCALCIRAYREGEPVEDIGRQPASMELDYRYYPILEEGQPTTIYGPGGSGKTYVGDYIAVGVQMNYPGIGNWLPKAGNVLYLDWEASKDVHGRRIWAIKQGLGISSDETISYRFCTQPLANDIEEIQRLVLERDIKLCIVDSQVAASGGDVEKADSANQYYNALRSLRCTSLTLDHVPKNVERGKAMPFGSVFKWNRARSLFELQKYQEVGENTLELGLYHRKHNEGRLIKPIGMRVDFHYQGEILEKVTFAPCELKDIPELSEGLPLHEQIAGLLTSGSMAVRDIAEALETKENKVRAILSRYKKIFTKVGNQWGLLTSELL